MLETLILCMALDYLTGMMAAGIFHKSKKSAHGGLESRSGWEVTLQKRNLITDCAGGLPS